MDNQTYNQIVNFIWELLMIACGMCTWKIRRMYLADDGHPKIESVLEPTKAAVLPDGFWIKQALSSKLPDYAVLPDKHSAIHRLLFLKT